MPNFVKVFLALAAVDLALIASLPFLGQVDPGFILVLVLLIPLGGAMVSFQVLNWMQEKAEVETASSLARLICGSSLAFLLFSTLAYVTGEPASLPSALLLFYIHLQVFRLAGAGLVNVVLALPLAVMGRDNTDRVCAIAAGLSGGMGLYLVQRLSEAELLSAGFLGLCRVSLAQPQAGGEVGIVLGLVALVSFGYGLLWGGVIQWLAGRLR